MATYKVIQDIEAEDKLIGPLTLRQSIYAGISLVCLYICFNTIAKHYTPVLLAIFLPPAVVTGFFAFPWKGEQPTEIWALARLRFMIKPRVRVWNQSGVKDVVTVTAPKKIEAKRQLTNNLSEHEVRSRLKALADTIDSRGWATRNASYAMQVGVIAPGMTPLAGIPSANDMFDERGSVSQNFDAMLNKSSQDQRQRVILQMAQAQAPVAPTPPAQTVFRPQLQQPMAAPQPVMNQPAPIAYGPQLPAPVMPIQQPPQFSPPAPQLQPTYQAPPIAPASPVMPNPSMPAVQPLDSVPSTPAPATNDYWFTGNPTNPGGQQTAVPPAYASAISAGKVMADVPVATAVEPTEDEKAFAIAARAQHEAQQQANHMKVIQTDGTAIPAVKPSIPGMIDYGRPQPIDDQMQYDTALPQSQPVAKPSIDQPKPAQPVTAKPQPAILKLAKNDDLDVATIARQASKEMSKPAHEVEIRLH